MRLPGAILQGILARAALVLLRVYLGVVFLLTGIQQLRTGAPIPAGLLVPDLILWGEILVGAALILGLFTRLAAVAGLLLLANYLLAEGSWDLTSARIALGVIALAIMIGAAGRTLGLDGLLARRWPRSPLW
jgi:uncharacterized membrane protein YphA (DoxX/SURF4 family)